MNIWTKLYKKLHELCGCTDSDHSLYDIDDESLYSIEARNIWKSFCVKLAHDALNVMKGKGSWLDVGAGTGNFCDMMRTRGVECTLVEVSIPEKKRLEERGYCVHTSLQDVGTFDNVFVNAVIEHVTDVQTFCKELYNATKPEGLVFIGTMNEIAILVCASLLRIVTFGMWDASYYVSRFHVHYLHEAGWVKLMETAGFTLVTSWWYPYSPSSGCIRRAIHRILRIQYLSMVFIRSGSIVYYP